MVQKELILKELQTQLHKAEDDKTKMVLNELIFKVASNEFAVRIW